MSGTSFPEDPKVMSILVTQVQESSNGVFTLHVPHSREKPTMKKANHSN